MSLGARVLGEERYAIAARRAGDFLLQNVRDAKGRLLHAYKDGRARFNAYLDDYACLVDGLAELYQATFEVKYLEAARDLAAALVERFHDPLAGGFFYTSNDHEELIARPKDTQDNATPSGNGMAATALVKLERLLGGGSFEMGAIKTLEMLSGQLAQVPLAGGQSLIALDFLLGPSYEVVVVEGDRPDEADAMIGAINLEFLPNTVMLRRPAGLADAALPESLRPQLTGKSSLDRRATAYICEHGTCRAPVTTVNDALGILGQS